MAQWFRRRNLKCEKFTDDRRRTPSDGNMSRWTKKVNACCPFIGGTKKLNLQDLVKIPWQSLILVYFLVYNMTFVIVGCVYMTEFCCLTLYLLYLTNQTCICYLDVNRLIPKISSCWAIIWSEWSEQATNIIFCQAG